MYKDNDMLENKKELKSLLTRIEGKKVWDFSFGESIGSIFSFECGEKILCEDYDTKGREYEGEYSFMVYCSWRISNSGKVLTSWKEDPELLKLGSCKIENMNVVSISMSDLCDLTIQFEDGFQLDIFSDEDTSNDFDCNWFFRDDRKYYSANSYGEIELEGN